MLFLPAIAPKFTGYADHPFQLIKLICENSNGTVEEFQKVGFVYKNHEAIDHTLRVGTGLDSQILGDFEIIGQIKSSFDESRNMGLINAFLDRLINTVIQTSKRIKNETEISSGATSVSSPCNTSSEISRISAIKTFCFSEREKLAEILAKTW